MAGLELTTVRARPTVLLIDDQQFSFLWVQEALDGLYHVLWAADSQQAFKILQSTRVATILLDIMLREENGLDLVPGLRRLSRAPILILTGHSTEEFAIEAVNLRVEGYLRKPCTEQELRSKLRALAPIDPVAHARLHIEMHYHHDLDATDIATHVGLSERHLRALFQEAYGMTLTHFLRRVRLEAAEELLRHSDQPIAAISATVGLGNPNRFRRLFTRAYGMPPAEFRDRSGSKVKYGIPEMSLAKRDNPG